MGDGAAQMPASAYSGRAEHTPASLTGALASLAAFAACTAATSVQAPLCRALIGTTTLVYAALYCGLRQTGLAQPPPGRLEPMAASEWRERVLSTVNAVVLSVGAVLCFSEWPGYESAGDAFVSSPDRWSHPVTFASLFAAWLHWDLVWVVWHYYKCPDPGSLAHHSMFLAMTHYVLKNWCFKKPVAWLIVCEVSTIFLNWRWALAVLGLKNTRAYLYVTAGLAVTYLATRVVGYGLGIADLWRHHSQWPGGVGTRLAVAGVHAGLALNLHWFGATVAALRRAGGGSSGKKKRAA
mmetsp:Transcript_24569/g.84023  ORF Transcript_24569/g.84023 Transcript_24569/m.84023 type:complete len:295 (-) Transcript_24569:171-1055(-)